MRVLGACSSSADVKTDPRLEWYARILAALLVRYLLADVAQYRSLRHCVCLIQAKVDSRLIDRHAKNWESEKHFTFPAIIHCAKWPEVPLTFI